MYMSNDVKNVSVEILKWCSRCEIEADPPYFLYINPVENVWGIIKKKLKGSEFENFEEL